LYKNTNYIDVVSIVVRSRLIKKFYIHESGWLPKIVVDYIFFS